MCKREQRENQHGGQCQRGEVSGAEYDDHQRKCADHFGARVKRMYGAIGCPIAAEQCIVAHGLPAPASKEVAQMQRVGHAQADFAQALFVGEHFLRRADGKRPA